MSVCPDSLSRPFFKFAIIHVIITIIEGRNGVYIQSLVQLLSDFLLLLPWLMDDRGLLVLWSAAWPTTKMTSQSPQDVALGILGHLDPEEILQTAFKPC